MFLQKTARALPPSCKNNRVPQSLSPENLSDYRFRVKIKSLFRVKIKSLTAMQTTLTAEGTATRGLVKCF